MVVACRGYLCIVLMLLCIASVAKSDGGLQMMVMLVKKRMMRTNTTISLSVGVVNSCPQVQIVQGVYDTRLKRIAKE